MRPLRELGQTVATLPRSRVVRNAASNYVAVGWMAALSLLTIPVYVRLLGSSEWGIVAACITLQGFLALMDVGFGQIMPRSFARIAGRPEEEAKLFAAYSRIYLLLGAAGFVAGQLAAGVAARRWFQASGDEAARLEVALRLILVQFFFQFANSAHTGFWSGMQLQEEGNLRTCAFATARHAAALASVFWVARSAVGYLVPFAVATAVEWLWNRRAILRRYRDHARAAREAPSGEVRALARDAGGFTVAILLGLVVTQVDRFVLSATVDLTNYGYYLIVANLGMAFMNFQVPLVKALFPRIAREDVQGAGERSATQTLLVSVVLLCVVPCLIALALAPQILAAWLRNAEIVAVGTLPLRLILAAVAVNALYGVIYQKMLSAGASRPVVAINGACFAVVALVAWLGAGEGVALGGMIWLALSTTQLVLGATWLAWRRGARAVAIGGGLAP